MQGHRRDVAPDELNPGDFTKRTARHGEYTFDAWWYCSPNGLIGRLSMPEDVAHGKASGAHYVEEHGDGMITVLPQPENSNSIKVEGWTFDASPRAEGEPLMSWHGYIRHGVWEEI